MTRFPNANVSTVEQENAAAKTEPWWLTTPVTDRRPQAGPANGPPLPPFASTSETVRRAGSHSQAETMRDTFILVGMTLAEFAAVVGAII